MVGKVNLNRPDHKDVSITSSNKSHVSSFSLLFRKETMIFSSSIPKAKPGKWTSRCWDFSLTPCESRIESRDFFNCVRTSLRRDECLNCPVSPENLLLFMAKTTKRRLYRLRMKKGQETSKSKVSALEKVSRSKRETDTGPQIRSREVRVDVSQSFIDRPEIVFSKKMPSLNRTQFRTPSIYS